MGAHESRPLPTTSAPAPATSTYEEVKAALLRAGIRRGLAQTLALNELYYFRGAEIDELTNKIKRPSPDYCPLRRDDKLVKEWRRPSLELIEESVRLERVLCVNRHGQFALRGGESEPYMALSHTWSEGLYADAERRGLSLWQIQEVFRRSESTDVEWLWIDSLAVPNWKGLSPREKELKRLLVNRMYHIYRDAAGVIVLDALLLQTHSTHSTDIAFAVLMGQWMTRVWTYQELKLANEAYFVTATGFCKYSEINSWLDSLTQMFAAGWGAEGHHLDKYKQLRLTWRRLQRVSGKPCIADIALACQNREATVPVDQAIGFCGALQVPRDPRDETLDQIMAKIYRSQPMWAKRMPFMHGPRLRVSPRWAPRTLCGLAGSGDWEDNDQRAEWDDSGLHLTCFSARVRHVVGFETMPRDTWSFQTTAYDAYCISLVFEAAGGMEGRCKALFCKEDSADDAQARSQRDMLLRSNSDTGHCLWLLTRKPLPKRFDPGSTAEQALLVFQHPEEVRFPKYDMSNSIEIVGCWGNTEMESRRLTLRN